MQDIVILILFLQVFYTLIHHDLKMKSVVRNLNMNQDQNKTPGQEQGQCECKENVYAHTHSQYHNQIYTSSTMFVSTIINMDATMYNDTQFTNYTMYVPNLTKDAIHYDVYDAIIIVNAYDIQKINMSAVKHYYVSYKEYYSYIHHYQNITKTDITTMYENNTFRLSIKNG